MQVITSVAALRARLRDEPRVAFVPTMGNLHEGHLQLMRVARQHAPCVVASIFVNPLQFGPSEDFNTYPRTPDEDYAALERLGVDVVFAPGAQELYPQPQAFFVEPPQLAGELCGAFRPGHFRGVATVVLKLFNIVQPEVAVFGKKDYQQLTIIRRMVDDFNLPITIVAGETQRADDGLALSSRNRYLSEGERKEATRLYRSLSAIRDALLAGDRDFVQLEAQAARELAENGWRVDYVAVRDKTGLQLPGADGRSFVVLGAAWLGTTRLIDNIEVEAGPELAVPDHRPTE